MTRLAFLIGFAIGAWWVLRERRRIVYMGCGCVVGAHPNTGDAIQQAHPDLHWAPGTDFYRYSALVYVDEDGYVSGSTLVTGEPMYVDPPDPYPSSLLRPNGWDG